MKSFSFLSLRNLRIFNACLLSFLMLIAPMAQLTASVNFITAAAAEQKANRKIANETTPRKPLDGTSSLSALAPPGPIIGATLTDSFVDVSPADGRADAGSIVTYTATVSNTGAADATNVSYADTIDINTTLLGGSIKVSPLGMDDTYSATQDSTLNIVAPGVLVNDLGTPTPTAVPLPPGSPTTQGGTVELLADGSFTFNPKAGFTGTDTFTYSITNGQAPPSPADATATVTLNVSCGSLSVTNPANTTGTVSAAFNENFTQTGGTAPITFTLNSGTLPTGLSLSSAGVLSGTPTQTGTFPITVKATDTNGCFGVTPTYNLTINCQTITVTNPATNTGTVGTAFSQTFTQTDAIGTATFTTASTLPTGLTLSTAGVLSGTPTQSGSFPIVVTVTDSNGCTGTGATYTLTINCQTITVTNPGTNTGTVGTAFSQTFTQTGAQGTATFSLNSGTLPTGLTLSSAGVLSGTPTQSGSFPITVKVTDSNGCTGTGSTYTLTINCQTITVTNPGTTTGTVGTAFSQTFTQTSAQGTATFSLNSGTLPTGLTLSSAGVLSGTPTQTGSFPITVKVTDSNGCTGTGATYTLVIGCQTITVTKPVVATGTVDAPFSQTFTQTGATGTATFTTASPLPAGLTLATNGTLSGTPTVTGSFPIVVTVTDSNGCTGTSSTYTLVIGCQTITVTNPGVSSGTVDAAFSQTFTQTGAHGTATFTLNSGSLPAGLTLSTGGVLSGTPTVSGSFPITVKVTDSNGCVGTGATYTLVIACQTITVTNPGVTTGTVDAPFSQTFTQTGAHGTATFTLNSGSLPSGLSLSTAGVLSGTPGQPGSFPITVKVTDSNGCTGISATYTLVIACQTITVTNPGVTTGTVDAAFSQTFTQSGVGTHTPATFTTASTLPTGLTLSTAGVLSGTPGQPGSFPIVVTVTDANGCTGTSATYTLVIACQTITVTNPVSTTGTYNTALSGSFTFTQTGVGTHTPATFTLNSGSLPAGVTLSSGGALSGTPTQTGLFPITVKVTDANGCTGTGTTYTLAVGPKLTAKTYADVGNTQLIGDGSTPTTPYVAASPLLPNGDTSDTTITYAFVSGPTQGTLTGPNASGQFVYTPVAGNNTTATFTYSGTSNGATTVQTATINFNGRVWYVNGAAGAGGTGVSNSPFNSLLSASAPHVANDVIFVHSAGAPTTTPGAISLKAGVFLWGQGTALPPIGVITISNTGATTKPSCTGTVTVTGAAGVTISSLDLNTTTANGITASGVLGTFTIQNNVAVSTTTGTGISLTNVTGTVNANTTTFTSTGSGTAVSADQGNAALNFGGAINNSSTGRTISITNRTGGTAAFTAAVSGTGTGILLNTNTGSTNSFTGGVSLTTAGNAAFTATGGGTVEVCDESVCNPGATGGLVNTITTTTGVALNVTGTTISSNNLEFQKISAGSAGSGPANGIVLNNTGSSGGLKLKGTGGSCTSAGTCTGGAIQDTSGAGISLTSTQKVSIDRIFIEDTARSGISGTTVVDFSLTNSKINNSGSSGAPVDDRSNVGFGFQTAVTENNLSGVVTITGNNLTNAYEHGIDIQNFSGTISDATLSNNTVTSSTLGGASPCGAGPANCSLGSGIRLLGFGNPGSTSNITKATIASNTITNFPAGAGITAQYGNNTSGPAGVWGTVGSATNRIFIQNNLIKGASPTNPMNTNAILMTLTGKGQANWLADANGTVANPIANIGGTEIGVTVRGVNPTAQCDITNNRIVGITNVAAQAIAFAADFLTATTDAPQLSGMITGNNISGQDGEAIQALATAGSTAHVDVSIKNNVTTAPNCGGCNRFGMTAQVGTSSATVTGAPSMCLDMSGNTAAGSGVNTGIGIRKKTAGFVFNIEGFAGGGDPTAFLTGQNPAGGGVIMISQTTGFGNCATAPLQFASGGVTPLAMMKPCTAASTNSVSDGLSQQQLDEVVSAAINRWANTGLTPQQMSALRNIKFYVADLPAQYLGEAKDNSILVDRTAGGKGWFVASGPSSDTYFGQFASTTRRYTDPLSAPAGRVDLLTAIEHEIGHKLGLSDSYAENDRDSVMYGYLTVGERRLPAAGQAINAVPSQKRVQHLKLRAASSASRRTTVVTRRTDKSATPLSGETVNVIIGTLPAGKSVTITYQVQLNTAMPAGTNTVTTQGTVTYDGMIGFGPLPIAGAGISPDGLPPITVQTDDPAVGGASDPTVTPIDAPTATGSVVSGQITDGNGNPVEGAGIRMSGTQNRLTVTDAQGFYHFDNVDANGFYTVAPSRANFSFSPSERSFSVLGQNTNAAFSASTSGSALNPLDTTEYFVRQQYVDFLGREPDEAGLNFWYNNIEGCGNDAQCRAGKRIDTSAAFFLSTEFRQTGYLVYRTYQAAFGDLPGAPVPVRLSEFKPDTAEIGNGVIVNQGDWATTLNNNTNAFMSEFVQRSRFTAAYPVGLSPAAFVDQLFAHAGVTPADGDRTAAIAVFGSSGTSADVAARGKALRIVAENSVLAQQEFTQAFVLMQYFGYLRRDANSGPDTDFSGYNFWLSKLNSFNGDFGNAEMVKSFLMAGEYRGRFPR